MLTDLYIRDFVIARDLHLELENGLTVLTGETGAGKSILIGALGLVLGDRADSQSVRNGTEQAELSAVFDVQSNPQAKAWLSDNELDSNDDCVVRRVIHSSGRSKAFINGKPVPAQQLRELGQFLVDIHGQHEHQAMLKPLVQRHLLDAYGRHAKQLDAVAAAYDTWKALSDQLSELGKALRERSARQELLLFQTAELTKLRIEENEYEQLSEEQFRLSHVATLAESSAGAVSMLDDEDGGCQVTLSRARRALSHVKTIDATLLEFDQLLENAEIQVDEAISGLNRYAESLEMDPGRRDFVEQRLDSISGMAKKHRVPPEQLQAHLHKLSEELATLANAEESIRELETQVADAAGVYTDGATKLTRARNKAAKKMSSEITDLVRQLGMPDSRFFVEVSGTPADGWRRDGVDSVQYDIQANPGEPARPVARVASGGELSRLSLAVQVISAATDSAPCMVFDEVDAGVGGAVADMIGRRLQELGRTRQILVVTHLPQVACHGHHHFKVSKTSHDSRTVSQVGQLTADDIIEELARMLGGAKLTATTRSHAQEMRSQAKKSA